MAKSNGGNRKLIFIGVLVALIGVGVSVLMFRDIPAPQTEKTVQLDNAKFLENK